MIAVSLDREVGGAERVAPGAVGRRVIGHMEECGGVEMRLGAGDGWQ